MILNKAGESFEYEGKTYTVGEFIYANESSDYAGLFGTITEIRDGDDKDTENDTPDIYCSFEDPIIPYDIKEIEERFSDLYGEPKTLEDLCFDVVIMAPEEITVVHDRKTQTEGPKVFLLVEDWATNDDEDVTVEAYSSYEAALMEFRLKLREEYNDGSIKGWTDSGYDIVESDADDIDNMLVIDSSKDSFEAYIGGYYSGEHYCLSIEEKSLISNV